MKKYSRFQFGWLIVIVFLIVIGWITVAYEFQWGNNPIPKPAYIVLLLLFIGTILFFYRLRHPFLSTTKFYSYFIVSAGFMSEVFKV